MFSLDSWIKCLSNVTKSPKKKLNNFHCFSLVPRQKGDENRCKWCRCERCEAAFRWTIHLAGHKNGPYLREAIFAGHFFGSAMHLAGAHWWEGETVWNITETHQSCFCLTLWRAAFQRQQKSLDALTFHTEQLARETIRFVSSYQATLWIRKLRFVSSAVIVCYQNREFITSFVI